MTTDQRLRAAKRALLQAATLLQDAAALGTMTEDTRGMLLASAVDYRAEARWCVGLRSRCNRDLDDVRQAKRKRGAA